MGRRALSRVLTVVLLAGALITPGSPAYAAEWQVDMIEHLYDPAELNITVGDTVVWRNIEPHEDDHTVTSHPIEDPNGPLDSGIIGPRETFSFTFTSAGDFPYYCQVHGLDMAGIVRVREAGQPVAVDDSLDAFTDGTSGPVGSVNVLANDVDREGDALSVTSFDQTTAKGGSIACSETGDCTYTAPAGTACGSTDSFTYTVTDGTRTDTATVDVAITCSGSLAPSDSRVTLRLRRHLVARGTVEADAAACESGRRVKIQRRTPAGWKVVGSDRSASDGSYSVRIPDRRGRYRAKVVASSLTSGRRCRADTSGIVRHTH